MHSARNRLLLLLVLLPVATVAFWATARAGTLPRDTGSLSTFIQKPTVGPTTGDPDVPQTARKENPTKSDYRRTAVGGKSAIYGMTWTGRFWMVRYLVAR